MHHRPTRGRVFRYRFVSDDRYERTGLLTHDDVWKFIESEIREVRTWATENAVKGEYKVEVHKSWFAGDIHRKQYVVLLADGAVAAAFKMRWC